MVRNGRKVESGRTCTVRCMTESIPIVLSFCQKGDMMPVETPRGTLPRRQCKQGAGGLVLEGQSILSSQEMIQSHKTAKEQV